MVHKWRLIGQFPILYYPQLEVPLRGHLTSSQYADSWFFFIGQVAAYKTGALGPQIERHFPCEARQAPPPGKDDMKMLRYQVRVRERERERERVELALRHSWWHPKTRPCRASAHPAACVSTADPSISLRSIFGGETSAWLGQMGSGYGRATC
jgi:hypothetical protein